jgi:hypothetical protein
MVKMPDVLELFLDAEKNGIENEAFDIEGYLSDDELYIAIDMSNWFSE